MWRLLGASKTADDVPWQQKAQQDLEDFNETVQGIIYLLNDQYEEAEQKMYKRDSVPHMLGRGTALFIKSLLSFDSDTMREAIDTMILAETLATEELRQVQKRDQKYLTVIYPAGSEFTSAIAITQLLRAILAVLSGSVTEAVKGFYNVRKGYMALKSVADFAPKLSNGERTASVLSEPSTLAAGQAPTTTEGTARLSTSSEEDEFFDAEENDSWSSVEIEKAPHQAPQANGHKVADSGLTRIASISSAAAADPDSEIFGMNPLDKFVYVAANVGYGALLLGISLVPPIFAALLRIIGFRGDRDQGLLLLWKAAELDDVYGSIGALILFEYYKAMITFCNIMPDGFDETARRQRLLVVMRQRFPQGRLWLIYEAAMAAANRDLERATSLINVDDESGFRQMRALQYLEHSVANMYMHKYEECVKGFKDCISMNDRFRVTCYYSAGGAKVELYRQAVAVGDAETAARYAKEAEELFELAVSGSGKNKFLAKRLSYEVLIERKVQKWKQRAELNNIDFIDAVGVSPLEEMVFFWNGFKRMRPEDLETSLANLTWSERQDGWSKDSIDEHGVLAVVKAALLRNMQRGEEAREVLNDILSQKKSDFVGGFRDDYVYPVALLELATNLWADSKSAEDLKECTRLIEQFASSEDFVLQEAFSIQLDMAREAIRKRLASLE